jgi:hypothetical protein
LLAMNTQTSTPIPVHLASRDMRLLSSRVRWKNPRLGYA